MQQVPVVHSEGRLAMIFARRLRLGDARFHTPGVVKKKRPCGAFSSNAEYLPYRNSLIQMFWKLIALLGSP